MSTWLSSSVSAATVAAFVTRTRQLFTNKRLSLLLSNGRKREVTSCISRVLNQKLQSIDYVNTLLDFPKTEVSLLTHEFVPLMLSTSWREGDLPFPFAVQYPRAKTEIEIENDRS